LLRADPERLGGAERGAPLLRHQHHGADRAATPTDQGSARDLAAIPDVFSPFLGFPLLAHSLFLPLGLGPASRLNMPSWRVIRALAHAISPALSTGLACGLAAAHGENPCNNVAPRGTQKRAPLISRACFSPAR